MFRTKLDLELKIQGKSGSPLFNLRETITIILNKHAEDPKVCIEVLIDSLVEIDYLHATVRPSKSKKRHATRP